MSRHSHFNTPEALEFLRELKKTIQDAKRPAEEIILDEVDLCKMLKISKRHAADLRREGQIKYSKSGGKLFYKLSWVLEYIDRNKVEPPQNRITSKP